MSGVEDAPDGEWGWDALGSEDGQDTPNDNTIELSPSSTNKIIDHHDERISKQEKTAVEKNYQIKSTERRTQYSPMVSTGLKGITSSPSFQELEKAIGATLALSLGDTESDINKSISPNTSFSGARLSSTDITHQKVQQQRLRQQSQHVQKYNQVNHYRPIPNYTSPNAKDELSQFTNESESRAIIVFHSPTASPVNIRNACSNFGVLYYIRPEFHRRGVTLISYFDLRAAVAARKSIADELGKDANASAHYSVMLHAANNNTEEYRLVVENIPEDCTEKDVEDIFSRYGELRSIQKSFGDDAEISNACSYIIEYYNIQDSRLAASELSATSGQIWGPEALVKFAPLDQRKQQLCRQLLATLSRWRTEMAAVPISPVNIAVPSYGAMMGTIHIPVVNNSIGYSMSPYGTSAQVYEPSHPSGNGYLLANSTAAVAGPNMFYSTGYDVMNSSVTLVPGMESFVVNNNFPVNNAQHMYDIAPGSSYRSLEYRKDFSNSGRCRSFHDGGGRSYRQSEMFRAEVNRNKFQTRQSGGAATFYQNMKHGVTDRYSPSTTINGQGYEPQYSQGGSSSVDYNTSSRPLHHNGGYASLYPQQIQTRKTKSSSDVDFSLDLLRIAEEKETRTTVMVRNIPNKYNQQMLLEEVNVHHEGTYDFFYLPIDFKNRCNVGYCFINFLEPQYIAPFVLEFNGNRWKSFNSEKVCAVSFARIQGKNAMIARFQNSSLLEKDDEYQPLLFYSSGPDRGKPEPFPVGSRSRSSSTTHGQSSVQLVSDRFPEENANEIVHQNLDDRESTRDPANVVETNNHS